MKGTFEIDFGVYNPRWTSEEIVDWLYRALKGYFGDGIIIKDVTKEPKKAPTPVKRVTPKKRKKSK